LLIDTKRINKSLHSSHPSGTSVVLHCAPDPQSEANFISSTIRHLVAHLGGLVTYKDFAILLRYGALSRSIEVGLQKAGIPNKMVGGHKFFERTE
jgi:DNA helicase-2/ATP-dependent DNA helicase PcrA